MRLEKFTPNLIYESWRKEMIFENGAYGTQY